MVAVAVATGDSAPDTLWQRVRQPSWAGSVGLFVVTAGWVIGLRPFSDNSFLTHLATGRIILDTGSVPSADPYTFTAAGEPWVVQSWLVSVLYAGAEQLGGLDAVRLVTGLLAGVLAGLGWTLLRPVDGILVRLAMVSLFLVVGAGLWAERPFMVGLICLSLTLLAVDGRLDPRWLVPVGWVWVNSHGSFPLGLVLMVLAALGTRLDGGTPATELRSLRWGALGMLLGAVGPLGPGGLMFPFELLQRQELLHTVIEWKAPTFMSASQRGFILQLAVVTVLLMRRPSYRSGLIVAVFTASALLGMRNLVVASLVMLPMVAGSLQGIGSLASRDRGLGARVLGTGALASLLILSLARLQQTPLDLFIYPVTSLAYLESSGVDTREVHLAAPDYVGNLVDYVYGPEQRTFYDDRFDMFPEPVSDAHQALLTGGSSLRRGLDQFDIDLVALVQEEPSAQILLTDPGWRPLLLDAPWVLLCRRGADLGGEIGLC